MIRNYTFKIGISFILISMFFLNYIVDNIVFFVYSNFFIWLFGVVLISNKLFVSKYYYFIFGLFFVLPLFILGDIDYLQNGFFLKTLFITLDEVRQSLLIINIFLSLFLLTYIISYDIRFKKNFIKYNEHNFQKIKIYYINIFISFIIVILYNITKILEVYKYSYIALQSGELETKKGLVILLSEIYFLVLSSIGLKEKNKIVFVLLMVYSFSLMLTGIRMPGALLAFFSFLYFYKYFRNNFAILMFLLVFIAPQILMITQALRVYGFDAFDYYDPIKAYMDLVRVLGFTYETLKVAIDLGNYNLHITPFFKLLQIIQIGFERIFNIDLNINLLAFGPEVTKYYDLSLYEKTGTTVGSSLIAESWYFFGYVGVFIFTITTFIISKYLSLVITKTSFVYVYIYMIVVPKFIMSTRNELFGWIFESIIFILLSIPFIILANRVFYKKKGGENSN